MVGLPPRQRSVPGSAECGKVARCQSRTSTPRSAAESACKSRCRPAASQIYDAADDGQAKGYAGITLDVEGGHVDVYWQGPPPAAVVSAINAVRESVRVNLHGAPYSRAVLPKDVQDIAADEDERAVPDEYRAHGLSVRPDGTGIEVQIELISPDEQLRRARRRVISTEIAPRGTFL